jgi:hypothetical protein
MSLPLLRWRAGAAARQGVFTGSIDAGAGAVPGLGRRIL